MRTSFGCLALVLCCQFADATPISTLTFDELPFQSVDGLFFRGVTFDFKIDGADSAEAFYASFGPGSLSTVTDPSLTGDASGELTLAFTRPTGLLEFGVALSTGSPLMPGLEVELFDASGESLALLSVDTVLVVDNLGFSEAQFAYSGTPVATAVIDFADGPGSFALDNLTYQIPEPSTLALAAVVVFGLFARSRRRVNRVANRLAPIVDPFE